MPVIELILLACSLAVDCAVVSMAAAAAGHVTDARATFRLSFHFGLFQFLMPVIGWLAGSRVQPYIASYDHWVAFLLLAFVAVRMIRSALRREEEETPGDPTHGWLLVSLAVATSIDALAVGLGLAALEVDVLYPSAVIGLVTVLLSVIAVRSGKWMNRRIGRKMQFAGGAILLLIGLKIVAEHIIAG